MPKAPSTCFKGATEQAKCSLNMLYGATCDRSAAEAPTTAAKGTNAVADSPSPQKRARRSGCLVLDSESDDEGAPQQTAAQPAGTAAQEDDDDVEMIVKDEQRQGEGAQAPAVHRVEDTVCEVGLPSWPKCAGCGRVLIPCLMSKVQRQCCQRLVRQKPSSYTRSCSR